MASVGVYGIIAFTVSRRTQELGIRMALGARRGDVIRMVMWQGLKLYLAGLGAGWIASFISGRILGASLFGISPFDLPAFAVSSVTLMGTAILATCAPALRAAGIDPIEALRCE